MSVTRRRGLVSLAASLWWLLLLLVGVAVMVFAFGYGAYYVNVPYQDPPPELAQRQAHHELIFHRLFLLGFALSMIGAASAAVALARRYRRRRGQPTQVTTRSEEPDFSAGS
jgi:hypothetical protein